MSILTFLRVGLGLPHQLSTASNSTDCLGVYATILNGPVPMAVFGSDHQLSGLCLTAFWSTIHPVDPERAMAVRNQPAGCASFTWTVYGSGAVRPVSVTDGSFFSRSASSSAPAFLFADTVS